MKKLFWLRLMVLPAFRLSFYVRSKQMHLQRIEKTRRQRPRLAARRDFRFEDRGMPPGADEEIQVEAPIFLRRDLSLIANRDVFKYLPANGRSFFPIRL